MTDAEYPSATGGAVVYWKWIAGAFGLIFSTLSLLVLWLIGTQDVRRRRRRSEEASHFRVEALIGRRRFRSLATSLRSGSVRVTLGGAHIDLRETNLHRDGADLQLLATFGSARVLVPDTWRVEVGNGELTDLELRVADPGSLPADAPHLRVQAVLRGASAAITTGD